MISFFFVVSAIFSTIQPATCQKPVMFGGGNFVSGAAIARLKLDLHRWLGGLS